MAYVHLTESLKLCVHVHGGYQNLKGKTGISDSKIIKKNFIKQTERLALEVRILRRYVRLLGTLW